MIHLALRSEYSFQKCYYHLEKLVKDAVTRGDSAVGVADINNTFAHIKLEQLCKKNDIKPIFGVRLSATEPSEKSRSYRSTYNSIIEFIFIAINDDGLKEINKLVNTAYDQFYYFPRLTYDGIINISDNVFVMCEYIPSHTSSFYSMAIKDRIDAYTLTHGNGVPTRDLKEKEGNPSVNDTKINKIAVPYIIYPNIDDKDVYEVLSHSKGTDIRTYGGYIKTDEELLSDGFTKDSIYLANKIAGLCNASIEHAEMVKFSGNKKLIIECMKGAIRLNIDIDDEVYSDRLKYEIEMIEMKDFQDYFFIVSDMLLKAKETMLVGPGRGSSGGSLVCYLMGITEIDPIEHGLLFERFIDVNRSNFPDVDTDIPDIKRQKVIKYLENKYGTDNVKSIGTVSTFKPKVAIGDFAKALGIPAYDTDDVKGSIIERSSGDARAALCILDTLEGTEAGRNFIKNYPEMLVVSKIEGHARHAGKHAAGVIVSNKPLYNYGGVNSRESLVMMNHWESESLGLLKIDVLGLRTLSVLEETARLAEFDFEDFYRMKLDDKETFKIFNDGRLYGIFQFEGKALGIVTKQMGVESFDDICAITSLGRPGALNSGGTAKYIKRRLGKEKPISYGDIYDRVTKDTYGIVIYQEQTMKILRELGKFSWENVNILRGAISKSYGDEFFAGYKDIFMKGSADNGYTKEKAEAVWKAVASMGSYGFNKSHAVAYSMISYWTAWCKAHHPLEFAAANLNHSKDDETAVKILRDFVVNDDIEYTALDPDLSDITWSIHDGKLLGGLTSMYGIGIEKAQGIIKTRKEGGTFTPAIAKKLMNPVTPFDILFPTEYYFGKLYSEPNKFGLIRPPSKIVDVNEPGDYNVIGIVTERDLRDRNDVQSVMKRGSKVDENQFYLNIYIEDDTDSIKCTIPPYLFDEMNGQAIAEKSIPGETWYMIKGKVRDQWRSISIEKIINLKEALGDKANAEKDI